MAEGVDGFLGGRLLRFGGWFGGAEAAREACRYCCLQLRIVKVAVGGGELRKLCRCTRGGGCCCRRHGAPQKVLELGTAAEYEEFGCSSDGAVGCLRRYVHGVAASWEKMIFFVDILVRETRGIK